MPRPKKKIELLHVPLEIAHGKLSYLEKLTHPIVRKRVEQAIDRHPDLTDLLKPILDELDGHEKSVVTAKAALSTVKSLIRKMF